VTKKRQSGGSDGPGRGARDLTVRVKTAKYRKISSTRWLQRQLNDPYVVAAKRDGYRSRAAYKIIEIDDAHQLLKPGARVVDLGATPGGWSQVAAQRIGAPGNGKIVSIDINEMEPIVGVEFIQLDFLDDNAPDIIKQAIGGQVDVVLSDMAAPATGHKQTDHIKIMALCEIALELAYEMLTPGGHFCAKVLQGGTEKQLLAKMKQRFEVVKHVKPKSSRADSAETYVLAKGFRGA
jgi:23S rRNA (uridine2552-2'-O)-methyltransferase